MCTETPVGLGDIIVGPHTHSLAYWTESNDPTLGGNGFSYRVCARAHWHTCIHLSMLLPSLFDVTSPLDFQWLLRYNPEYTEVFFLWTPHWNYHTVQIAPVTVEADKFPLISPAYGERLSCYGPVTFPHGNISRRL